MGNIIKEYWNSIALRSALYLHKKITNVDLKELMNDQFGVSWQDRVDIINKQLKPETIQLIINQASPNASGNLGQLYELFTRVKLDTRIGGMIEKRLEAVTRSQYHIKKPATDNAQAAEAAELLEKWIERIRFKELLERSLDGKFYGVTAFENVIRQSGDTWYIEEPSNHQIAESRWRMGTKHSKSSKEDYGKLALKKKFVEGMNDKNLLFLHDDSDINPLKLSKYIYKSKDGYYDTTGILARVLTAYVIKIYATKTWLHTAEKHGMPFIYALLEETEFKDDEYRSLIRTMLQNLGSSRWGIFPKGIDFQTLDAKNLSANSQLFKDLIDAANVDTAISILGQNLSTEVKQGSFAAAVSHSDVEFNKTETDCEWISEAFDDSHGHLLIKLNFPDLDQDLYPKLHLKPQKTVDLSRLAEGYKKLSELVPVPVDEVYENAQVRKPRKRAGTNDFEEEVIQANGRNSIFRQLTQEN